MKMVVPPRPVAGKQSFHKGYRPPMPQAASHFEVGTETATGRGWHYEVTLTTAQGVGTQHAVTLCWHDHDYWCGGAIAPSRLVERLLALLAQHLGKGHTPATLPPRFDCATARRWLPEIDDWLREGSGVLGGPCDLSQ